ncbi:ribonuclease P protein subunit [Nanoarchaeota archaeon]
MKKAVENLLRGEFIGLRVKVGQTNGTIIDETKKTITLQTKDKQRKRFVKTAHQFEFKVDKKRVEIDGSLIAIRPEQRITLKLR